MIDIMNSSIQLGEKIFQCSGKREFGLLFYDHFRLGVQFAHPACPGLYKIRVV